MKLSRFAVHLRTDLQQFAICSAKGSAPERWVEGERKRTMKDKSERGRSKKAYGLAGLVCRR